LPLINAIHPQTNISTEPSFLSTFEINSLLSLSLSHISTCSSSSSLSSSSSSHSPSPNNSLAKIYCFLDFMKRKINQLTLSPGQIWNFDEVPMYIDMPYSKTIERKGAKSVVVRTTGHEKSHFTLVFSCAADGTLAPPLAIFKGSDNGPMIKKLRKQVQEAGLNIKVSAQTSGWMTEGGMVKELIPLLSFKDRYRRRWDHWMLKNAFAHNHDIVTGLKLKSPVNGSVSHKRCCFF